jgi:hypothetical protein
MAYLLSLKIFATLGNEVGWEAKEHSVRNPERY